MIVCDTWYKFLESTKCMEMVKFIYLFLFFALFVMSNKKLKIQDQKHQYFYSISPPVAEKILSPQSSSLPLCNQRLFLFSEFWQPTQKIAGFLNAKFVRIDQIEPLIWHHIKKKKSHFHHCLEPQMFSPWGEYLRNIIFE